METAKLIRFDSSDLGTFGKLFVKGHTWYTGELPDRNNASGISCIPLGTYTVKWTLSPRLKRYTYEVFKVPNRSGIRFHSANYMGDASKGYKVQVQGCISLGNNIGIMHGQKALLLSRPAVLDFEAIMNKQTFLLEITKC